MSPTSVETGTRVPLGQLLVNAGLLTEAELQDALAEQQRSRRPLGEILVERGFVSGGAVANALASQHGGLLRTEYGVATGLKPRDAASSATTPPLLPPALPGAPTRVETLDDHAAALAARFGNANGKHAEESPSPATPDPAGAPQPDDRDERLAALETQVEALTVARDKALHAAALAIQTLDELLADSERRREDAEARCAALEAELERSRVPSSERSTDSQAPEPGPARSRHAILVPTPTGPELVARVGEVPAVGKELELVVAGQRARFRVNRIEPAPLPGPHLDCAYLELVSL
jgi:hypothetical protein